jgi:hypothetical protein
MPRFLLVVALLVPMIASPSVASAQPVADHLKCYKVKDSRSRASYTADLQGLSPEPGCTIKVPGKLLCVETTKTNRQPPADGEPSGNPAGRFVCYAVKCPKAALPTVAWLDQFGAATLTPSAPKLLCAPEISTTTTTTSCPATTTMPHCFGSVCLSFALCAPGQTCQSDGTSCQCAGPPVACGDLPGTLSGQVCFYGECPPGQTCGSVQIPGTCFFSCTCS